MQSLHVAIVGAGIGGLSAALALGRRGFTITVLEQAAALGEIGAGLHLSPNGLKVLEELGLGAALAAVAARPQAIATRHFASGEPNFETALGAAFESRFGAPFWSFHRADLHAVLTAAVAAAPTIRIELGQRVVGVTEHGEQIDLECLGGRRFSADVAVIADGVHSELRNQLHGETGVRYTGHVAYRGMAALNALGVGVIEPKLNIWVGPGRHFVAYPVRRGELINYVALVEEDGWLDESWTTRADQRQLAAAFVGWHAPVQRLIEMTARGECYKWALLGRDPLPRWAHGRTTLLGDAAHPMVPYLAQGAVMAVEDAWVLAACLARGADVAAGLSAYEDARRERTARVQAAAWEQGRLNHAVGRDAEGEQFQGGGFADPAWLYGYDAVALFPP
jgi:salicylate hydroxylase